MMNFNHEKIPRFMPSVSYTDPVMYVQGLNGFNDSRQKGSKPIALVAATDDDIAVLRDRFAIDITAVQAAFAARAVPGKT